MSFSFIHISDIHLGRPFSDLSKFCCNRETEEIYKSAVQTAFNKFVDFALFKHADFVLISGDTFDSGEQDFESKLILKNGLRKLDNAEIKVFLVCGNHDPLYSYSSNTFNFDKNSNIKIVGLNTNNPDKFYLKNDDGKTFAIVRALSFEKEEFFENPVKYFELPNFEEKNAFNIGLLHCDIGGNADCPYAPCTKGNLKDLNYDYWALGHIHKPDLPTESIQYAGTLQGRNIKETGSHGIKYVKVDDKGNIVENLSVPLDIVRFENIFVDISSVKDITEIVYKIKEKIDDLQSANFDHKPELLVLNVELSGTVEYYEEINEEFFDVMSEHIKNEYEGKVLISKYEKNIFPKINKEDLCNDTGIIGEIYKTSENIEKINEIYDLTEQKLKNIIYLCDFTEDEYNNFKNEIIQESKLSCLNICSCLYGTEKPED